MPAQLLVILVQFLAGQVAEPLSRREHLMLLERSYQERGLVLYYFVAILRKEFFGLLHYREC